LEIACLRHDGAIAVVQDAKLILVVVGDRRLQRLTKKVGAEKRIELVETFRLRGEHGPPRLVDVVHITRAEEADRLDECERLLRRNLEPMGAEHRREIDERAHRLG
jgi:hypothetical protein